MVKPFLDALSHGDLRVLFEILDSWTRDASLARRRCRLWRHDLGTSGRSDESMSLLALVSRKLILREIAGGYR
jgi:hypothetical protein